MLIDEYNTATCIRSRVGRLSFLSAITSAQQRLKLYSSLPPSGLLLYTGKKSFLKITFLILNNYIGTIVTDEGIEKRLNIDLAGPTWKGKNLVVTTLYLLDSKFHVEVRLKESRLGD